MFYFDPTYVLILIGVVISMAASAKLNSTYQRYSAVRSMCGMTGADAAKRLLANQGIYDVTVRRVPGNLTAVSYTHLDVYKRQSIICPPRQPLWPVS